MTHDRHPQPALSLRHCKGAAGSVLLALLLHDGPLTAVQLEQLTGYSDKPVREALQRLAALRYVDHHGRLQGWTLTDRARAALAAPSPPRPAAPRANRQNGAQNPHNRRTEPPFPGSDQNCTESDLPEEQKDHQTKQIRSDRPPQNAAPPSPDPRSPAEITAVRRLLRLIGIEEPAFSMLLARARLVELLATYWATLGQTWIHNPRGWVIKSLSDGYEPKPPFIEFARVWLAMTEADYEEYLQASWTPFALAGYWREWDLSPAAIDAHGRIKQYGGLDLFDDFQRPILPAGGQP